MDWLAFFLGCAVGLVIISTINYHKKSGNEYFIYVGPDVEKYCKSTIGVLTRGKS